LDNKSKAERDRESAAERVGAQGAGREPAAERVGAQGAGRESAVERVGAQGAGRESAVERVGAQGAGREPAAERETHDATRRTRLANERTYLAWWRTGLASLAVGLGTGKLVPAVTSGAQWPYTVAGVGFSLIGVFFIAYAFVRHREVEDALSRGDYAPPQERLLTALAVIGVLFGAFVLVIIAVQGK
jgi:putative membrane protein